MTEAMRSRMLVMGLGVALAVLLLLVALTFVDPDEGRRPSDAPSVPTASRGTGGSPMTLEVVNLGAALG